VNILEQKWYVVDSCYIPQGCSPYIIAGHWDPHVAPMVVDGFEPYLMYENEVYETEDEAAAANWVILRHICELHNATIKD